MFYTPLDTEKVISEAFFAADLLAKLNQTQQKQATREQNDLS